METTSLHNIKPLRTKTITRETNKSSTLFLRGVTGTFSIEIKNIMPTAHSI